MFGFQWLWLCVLSLGVARGVLAGQSSRFVESDSSAQLYCDVLDSDANTLVYVYKPGCKYCAELEPKLAYLADVFPDEDSVRFVRINGMRSNALLKDLQVRSFPQLFVFKNNPGKDAVVTDASTRDCRTIVQETFFLSKFHGERSVKNLAQWISDNAGVLPRWPDSSVNYEIRNLTHFKKRMPPSVELLMSGKTVQDTTTDSDPVCLAFVNSWIDIQYQDLFNGDLDTLILEKLSKRWPQISFHVIDSSLPELSHLSNFFQISYTPTLSFIYKGKILKAALLPADPNSLDKELEYFESIISKCVVPGTVDSEDACTGLINSLPLAEFYSTRNSTLAESFAADTTPDEHQDDEDDEDEFTFDMYDL